MEEIIDGLLKGDTQERAECAKELGVRGEPECIPYLIDALKDDEPLVRANAALALGHMKPEDYVVKALMNILEDESWVVRHDAAIALGELGFGEAVDSLIELYDDDEVEVRKKVVEALGKIGDEKSIKYLEKMIGDDEIEDELVEALAANGAEEGLVKLYSSGGKDIRVKAIKGLAGSTEYKEILLDALKDNSWRVREEAARSLKGISDDEVIDALLDALDDEKSYVVIESLRSLGEICNSEHLDNIKELYNHPESSVREEWAKTLTNIGRDDVFNYLIDAFEIEENPRVLWTLSEAMGKSCEDPDELIELYGISEGYDKIYLAAALAWAGERKSIGFLIDCLKDHRWKVRQKVTESLRGIPFDSLNKTESGRLKRGLLELLRDPDKWVRVESIKTLLLLAEEMDDEDIWEELFRRKEQEVDEDVAHFLDESLQ